MSKQMVSNQNFLHKSYAGNTAANQRIKYHIHFKDHNFEFKSYKKPLKNLGIFSNFKHKINLNK